MGLNHFRSSLVIASSSHYPRSLGLSHPRKRLKHRSLGCLPPQWSHTRRFHQLRLECFFDSLASNCLLVNSFRSYLGRFCCLGSAIDLAFAPRSAIKAIKFFVRVSKSEIPFFGLGSSSPSDSFSLEPSKIDSSLSSESAMIWVFTASLEGGAGLAGSS